MKTGIFVSALASLSLVAGRPLGHRMTKREVPQEHSHNAILATVQTSLQTNNPAGISDSVFGLLGNAAAAGGAGTITDTECLQQATADQAFTNAKAANDVTGMTAALIYRALERNTGSVGLQSNSCTSIQAANPEIAAVSQHQDPASTGAAATNKAIVLALAQQIASIGGNAQDALQSGTFAPGQIGDPTAKGNTCDVADDTAGCIVSQNLLVDDATADEINAAVAGGAGTAAAGNGTAASSTAPFSNDTSSAGASSGCSGASSAAPPAAANSTASTGAATGTVDLGDASCSDPAIAFGVGFDNRKEASFEPDDKATFAHGSAQNPGIVANFICDRLNDQCKAPAATVSTCRAAAFSINGQVNNPAAADTFNAALGVTASNIGVDAAAGTPAAAAASPAPAAGSSSSSSSPTSTSSSTGSAAGAGSATDLGSCTDATITFGPAADRANADAFSPTDSNDFNHGSALNIGVISAFICQQLNDKCKASQAAVSACQAGQSASGGLSGQAAADAFNGALAA